MPVLCPACTQPIPPEDVNVAKDVAFCRACNNAFSISARVQGENSAPPRIAQPAGSRVLLTRDDARIAAVLPALGFKGAGCFFAIFSAFWNFVTWMVFFGFVGAFLSSSSAPLPAEAVTTPPPKSGSDFAPWMFIFFIPHMTIGVVTALIALYCIKGDVAIAMDRAAILMQRRLFGYTWSRSMPFEAITDVRLSEAYKSNNRPVYGVGVQFEGSDRIAQAPASMAAAQKALKARPMVFGSGLSEEEKQWLAGEFHDAWRTLKN